MAPVQKAVLNPTAVQKAVLNHTLGAAPSAPSAKRRPVWCSVCQLRFNSQSQALAHFKGTKHAKKLKALDAPKSKLATVNPEIPKSLNTSPVCYTDRKGPSPGVVPLSPMLTLAPPTPALAPPTTPGTETTSATAGGQVRPSPRPAPPPSEPVAVPGAGPEPGAEPELGAEPEPGAGPEPVAVETEEEKARRLLYCSLCKVAVNSASQLDAHSSGTKHKTMLEARSGVGSIKSFPRSGVKGQLAPPTKTSTGLQNKTFHCETCDVHVNSETQLKQHITSRRHKDRAAGKPAKPKYSPYSKPPPRGPATPPVQSQGKELFQPVSAPQMLPAHLAAVAAAMGSSFSLRPALAPGHAPNHAPALFQTQLLRPAPGPVRTAHPQVLFSPY